MAFFNAYKHCGFLWSFEGHLFLGIYWLHLALWIPTRMLKLSFVSYFVASLCLALFMTFFKFIFRIRILLLNLWLLYILLSFLFLLFPAFYKPFFLYLAFYRRYYNSRSVKSIKSFTYILLYSRHIGPNCLAKTENNRNIYA